MQIFERVNQTRFEGETGTIKELSERVIEVRIAQGTEIQREEAAAIQRCIRTLTGGRKAALLIDRSSSHVLSFEAQQVVASDDELVAIAYLVSGTVNRAVVDYSKRTYFKHVPVQSFTYRDRAVAWLEKQIAAQGDS